MLNTREEQRLRIMNMVLQGLCGLGEAAGLMGLSKRQARRLMRAYRKEGAMALAHGNRGRRPANAVSEETRGG